MSVLSVTCTKRIQIKIDFLRKIGRESVRIDPYTFCDYLEQNGHQLGWDKVWLVRDYHAKLMTMIGKKTVDIRSNYIHGHLSYVIVGKTVVVKYRQNLLDRSFFALLIPRLRYHVLGRVFIFILCLNTS